MNRIYKTSEIITCFISLCIFSSCESGDGQIIFQERLVSTLHINVENAENVFATDIFSEYKMIELITPDEFYLGRINKIINQDSILYVIDKELSVRINSYDFSGKFLNSFSFNDLPYAPIGIISDFDVFENNGIVKVHLNDPSTRTFITLNEELKFESITKFPNSFMHFRMTKNHIFQFRNEMAYNQEDSTLFYNFLVTDHLGGMQQGIDKFIIPVGEKIRYAPREPLYKNHNDIFFNKWANDTIYTFKQGFIRPLLYIDFGDKSIRHHPNIDPLHLVDFTIENPRAIATGITNSIYTDDFVFFQFIYDLDVHFGMFHWDSKKLIIGNNLALTEGDAVPYPITYNQGYFVSFIDDTQLSIEKYKTHEINLINEVVTNGKIYAIIFKY